MAAATRQLNNGADGSPSGPAFSFFSRTRIRRASEEAHGVVLVRLRGAKVQGDAASDAGLAAEVRGIAEARRHLLGKHGPARDAALTHLRACYLAVAASAILMAERVTRPEELPKGAKSKTERYRRPDFTVPDDIAA